MTRNKDFRKKYRTAPDYGWSHNKGYDPRHEWAAGKAGHRPRIQKGHEMTAKTMNPAINEEYYTIEIPMRTIESAIGVLKQHQESWATWHEERENHSTEEKLEEIRKRSGDDGVQKVKQELEAIDAKQQERIAQARAKISDLRTECFDLIDAQVTPKGADILGENEADFALVKNGLIDRPEHLRAIVDAHQNAAFRNAAQEYAARKMREAANPIDAEMWEGFEYKAKEKSVRDYCTQMFDMFDRAAAVPQGLAMMQALDEYEPIRAAKAYDVVDCLPAR